MLGDGSSLELTCVSWYWAELLNLFPLTPHCPSSGHATVNGPFEDLLLIRAHAALNHS